MLNKNQSSAQYFGARAPVNNRSISHEDFIPSRTARRRARVSLFVLAFLSVGAHRANADDRELDIGRSSPAAAVSDQVSPGVYSVRVVGQVKAPYRIEVRRQVIPIDALTKPGDVVQPFVASPEPVSDTCRPLKDAIDAASAAATNDKDEAKFYARRQEAMRLVMSTMCAPPELPALSARFQAVVADSTSVFGPYELQAGERLTVAVTRILPDGKDGAKWAYELSTGSRGSWQASWGIGLIPAKDEEYFTSEGGESQFTIAKKNDHGGVDPAAAVFYTWRGEETRLKPVTHGPTVGLGLDKNNLMVFGGWNWTFQERVGVNVGVVFHQQKRLSGEYTEGQIVSENLTPDALEETVYKPNGFVGIAMRF